MTDAALVARVLGGELESFSVLVQRYSEPCGRFAQRMLGNRQDAEDALQETFLRAYRALGRYREQDTFRAWLYRILVNQCRSLARQRTRYRRRVVTDGVALARALAPSTEDASDARDALQRALDRLEPLLREAFLLKYGEGLDYAAMSEVTGSGVSALKMRVKRACDALRPELEVIFHE
jgi:RNA polymerase sigma-70 factor (ECF subfamily)